MAMSPVDSRAGAVDRFDRQKRIAGWNQDVLAAARVLLVGAGTTGNEIAKNLALLGIGSCDIADNDLVEEVNLSRCVLLNRDDIRTPKAAALAARAQALADGHSQFTSLNLDIVDDFGSGRYREYQAVISAVDNLEARAWINRYCQLNRVTMVDTGIDGLTGHVTVVPPDVPACLECSWGPAEYARLAERHSCSKLGLALDKPIIPMVVTTAAQVAGLAAELLIRILHGRQVESVRTWMRQGEYDAWLTWTTPEKEDCVAHRWRQSEPLLAGSLEASVATLIDYARERLQADQVELSLDRPVVYTVSCRQCGHTQPIDPVPLSKFQRSICCACNWLEAVPADASEILRELLSPRAVGVPERHLARVSWLRKESVLETWMLLE